MSRARSAITGSAAVLEAEQAEDVRIVMGGVIPRSDYKFLYGAGVDLILRSLPADRDAINQLLDLFG